MRLFNESEEIADQGTAPGDEERVSVSEHKRRRSTRQPLPAHLPRIEVEHDLPE